MQITANCPFESDAAGAACFSQTVRNSPTPAQSLVSFAPPPLPTFSDR